METKRTCVCLVGEVRGGHPGGQHVDVGLQLLAGGEHHGGDPASLEVQEREEGEEQVGEEGEE